MQSDHGPDLPQDLIDSIFRNFYVPPVIFGTCVQYLDFLLVFSCIYLLVLNQAEDGAERRVCVDGKQRLTSIYRYALCFELSSCCPTHTFGTCHSFISGEVSVFNCVLTRTLLLTPKYCRSLVGVPYVRRVVVGFSPNIAGILCCSSKF